MSVEKRREVRSYFQKIQVVFYTYNSLSGTLSGFALSDTHIVLICIVQATPSIQGYVIWLILTKLILLVHI